ncbi:GATA-type zinc finger protein 1 isoform X2 [Notamacropus eugenii]|uniref:GATA-type zinc finger protein 1 isoform X2 n=1 Tax=Notamacropus eugenii TaxID=9315 RepID=UPI003B66E76E
MRRLVHGSRGLPILVTSGGGVRGSTVSKDEPKPEILAADSPDPWASLDRQHGPAAWGLRRSAWAGAFAVTTPPSAAACSLLDRGGGGGRSQKSQRSGVGSPALAMEGEPTPDFSVLRDLLAPPCLDPEPELEGVHPLPHPSPCAGSLILPQENQGPGDSRSPWLALPAAATGLRFLQETAERLLQAPVPEASRAELWLEPPVPPRALAPLTAPGGPGAWDAVDSLALISLQCHRLSPPRARKQVGLGVGLGGGPGLQALAGRTLRKQPHPQRGAEGLDPGFQGVVLRMHLKPDEEGHQLLITAQFSSACGSRSWGALPSPMGASTSNHQDSPGSRCCASCRTQRTPLWRDAEDGTPLCNACGIRSLESQEGDQ